MTSFMDRQVQRQEEVKAKALETRRNMSFQDMTEFLEFMADKNDSTFLAYYGQWKGLSQFWYIDG